MALLTNTQTDANGVVNTATGSITTDSGAAAATTLSLGFIPRVFRWMNITSTAAAQKDEWYAGMAAGTTLRTAPVATTPAASQMSVATSSVVVNGDGTVTIPATLIPVSSTFAWEAIG